MKPSLNGKSIYRSMVIIGRTGSDIDLKSISASYANELKSLGATTISMVSRGERELAYGINGSTFGHYIEMCFEAYPQVLEYYKKKLSLDQNVFRYTIFRS